MSAPQQQMLKLGEHPVYPPGYPEKNKVKIDPIHAEINRLMKTGMPFMFAAKQAMREAAAAAANSTPQ
jgi:hypothetical protein